MNILALAPAAPTGYQDKNRLGNALPSAGIGTYRRAIFIGHYPALSGADGIVALGGDGRWI